MLRSIDSASIAISRHLQSVDRTASRLATATGPGASDLARDTVQLMVDAHVVAANANVVRTADELVGTVIDIVA